MRKHGSGHHQELPHPGPDSSLLPFDFSALSSQGGWWEDAGRRAGEERGRGGKRSWGRGGGGRRGRIWSSGGRRGVFRGCFPKPLPLLFRRDQAAAEVCGPHQQGRPAVLWPLLWRTGLLWHLQRPALCHDQRPPALLRRPAENCPSRKSRGARRQLCDLFRSSQDQQFGAPGWTVPGKGPRAEPRPAHDQEAPTAQFLDWADPQLPPGQLRRHCRGGSPKQWCRLTHTHTPQHTRPRRHAAGLQWLTGVLGPEPRAHTHTDGEHTHWRRTHMTVNMHTHTNIEYTLKHHSLTVYIKCLKC